MESTGTSAKRSALRQLKLARCWLLGAKEFRSCIGMIYDGDYDSPRSRAYDHGRETAHRLTLRRFDI